MEYSQRLPVQCEFPMGSLLGPLFFNIFINDINMFEKIACLRIYAIDTTECANNKNPPLLALAENEDMINSIRRAFCK